MYWPGFTVYVTYSDISLSMSINHCEVSVELPYLRFLNYFEGSWVRRLLLLLIEEQGLNSCFEGLQRRSDFSPENRTTSPSNLRRKSVASPRILQSKIHPKGLWDFDFMNGGWAGFFGLHSKRFQSSYCAKVRAGAKKKWKWEGDEVKTRF